MRAPAANRAENSRQTRDALLRAAVRVVSRHGFAGASVQRITQACGVAQGSLYTYFGSHRELLEELLPHEGILLLRALGRSVDHEAGHFENERRTFEALFDYLRRKPYFLRLLTEAEIAAPLGFHQHARNIEDRYLRALQRGRDAGEVRPLHDAAYRVIAGVLSSSRGYIGIGLCSQDAKRLFHPPPIESWVSAAYVRFVRHGLGCPSGAIPVPAPLSALPC
ncbi:MAG TPA: TetR family transcriptional regulator, partial [Quisquiliibacterium sp.]|nr:TetR family transcriptional regulator [Quisquiliibacterium sp.]